MAIYIIVLIFEIIFGLLLSVNKKENSKKIFIIITFVILTIVAGIRTKDVGTDTEQYYRAYKRIGTYTSINSAFNERYEKGFVILCYGLNKISSDPQILIFITSAFINFCVLRFIYRNSNNLVYSVYLYITLNFYFSYMNIMRQAVAIGFLLLAFENLKSKKYVKYFLEILLA
jgi:capsular polysaccharide biosynthesis protein